MFTQFINSLKRPGNESLIEAVKSGYEAIFEDADKLTFTVGNTKLGKKIQIFSIPAGKTCPGAVNCKAHVLNKKICDTKEYNKITNVRIYDDKENDNKVKINPQNKDIHQFKENMHVGITDKPVKRITDINNVEEKTIKDIDNNTITFDSDVKTKLPATMNNNKALDTDNPNFRCFAASEEVNYKNTYNMRRRNFELIKETLANGGPSAVENLADLINRSLNTNIKYVRIHESGDFYDPRYLQAWIKVANDNPTMIFYAYTKSIDMYRNYLNKIPENLIITGSMGGRYDEEIKRHNIPHSKVFMSYHKVLDLNKIVDADDRYPIDFNDEIAQTSIYDRRKKFGTPNFALLIHATQSPQTLASKETVPNSAFLHGMKAHKEGYEGTKDDMLKFNADHNYINISSYINISRNRPTRYVLLYDDWKAGWDQYAEQESWREKFAK